MPTSKSDIDVAVLSEIVLENIAAHVPLAWSWCSRDQATRLRLPYCTMIGMDLSNRHIHVSKEMSSTTNKLGLKHLTVFLSSDIAHYSLS